VNDALELSSIESLCGGPFLGAIDVRGGRLAVAHKDGEVRGVISLGEFVFHELYQLISKTEEDMQRERNDAIVQKGEKGRVHHAFKTATGPLRALRRSFVWWRREVKGVQQRAMPS